MRSAAALLVAALAVPGATVSVAAEEPENPNRAMYQRYCGACHGPTGRGDGIAATFLTPKPTDLATIAKRSGGTFPAVRVARTIDGRETIRAHGDPTMPVWGEVLTERAAPTLTRHAEVRGTILMITEYLQSIQER